MPNGLQCNSTALFISYQFEMLFWIDLKDGVRTIAPLGKLPPPLRLRLGFGLGLALELRLAGAIFLGVIILEPYIT